MKMLFTKKKQYPYLMDFNKVEKSFVLIPMLELLLFTIISGTGSMCVCSTTGLVIPDLAQIS